MGDAQNKEDFHVIFLPRFSTERSIPGWGPVHEPCAVGRSHPRHSSKVSPELLQFKMLSNQQSSFREMMVFKALPVSILENSEKPS